MKKELDDLHDYVVISTAIVVLSTLLLLAAMAYIYSRSDVAMLKEEIKTLSIQNERQAKQINDCKCGRL